jgi:hypothetical protein
MRNALLVALSFLAGLAVANAAHHETRPGIAGPSQPVAQLGASSVWSAPNGKAK